MNEIRPNETRRVRLEKSPSQTTQSHNGAGHSTHRMTWMMLLCLTVAVAGVTGWNGGIGVGGVFCGAMMIAMMWMMIRPAARMPRNSDRDESGQERRRP